MKVALFAAERRIPIEIHAYTDDAANAILDVFEAVHKTHPFNDLRWSIAQHPIGTDARPDAEDGSRLYRADGPYFEAPAIREANGAAVAAVSPPTRLAIDKGIMVAGGTVWYDESVGHMPTSLIHDEDGIRIVGDMTGNFGQMLCHGVGVAPWHDQRCRFPKLRADGAEDVG